MAARETDPSQVRGEERWLVPLEPAERREDEADRSSDGAAERDHRVCELLEELGGVFQRGRGSVVEG